MRHPKTRWSPMSALRSTHDCQSIGIHAKGQHATAVRSYRGGNLLVTAFANEQHEAAAATCSAHLCCEGSFASRG